MGKAKATAQTSPTATNVMPITQGRKPHAVGAEATNSANVVAATDVAPAVIVFGKDEGGKAHASRFGEADAELAIKAAGLMGFQVLRVTTPDIASKALEAPQGRIFASGRCFAPFVRMPLYEALCGFEGAFAPPPPPEPQPAPPPAITGAPQIWDDIRSGSLVLATMGDDTGWFESVVVEARGDDLFVLRWHGWPDDPEFVRRRDNLALLPPGWEPATDAASPADPAA